MWISETKFNEIITRLKKVEVELYFIKNPAEFKPGDKIQIYYYGQPHGPKCTIIKAEQDNGEVFGGWKYTMIDSCYHEYLYYTHIHAPGYFIKKIKGAKP